MINRRYALRCPPSSQDLHAVIQSVADNHAARRVDDHASKRVAEVTIAAAFPAHDANV
jgi:hypothetical protein